MRRGDMAGIFLPTPLDVFPFELKKDIFLSITESIKRKLKARGVREEEVLEDFERHRKTRR